MGFLTSANWIYTVIATFITMLGTELYYIIYLGINDTGVLMYLFSISLLMSYCSYQFECKSKSEFTQMSYVKKMNEDLQNILMTFPEGIILYNEEKDDIVLANKELRRILKC